jgi:pyridoxine 5-phosphate synthase
VASAAPAFNLEATCFGVYPAAVLKLGVNIDHVATLRQARYKNAATTGAEPDPVQAARAVERAGAHGITVHLREDRRHIQDRDVRRLRRSIRTRLNLEMADVPAIVAIAERIRPDEVCLVPEKRQEVTTEGGLDVAAAAPSLKRTVARLQRAGISVSLFIDPSPKQIRAAAATGAEFVELHTGAYANCRDRKSAAGALKKLADAARLSHQLGLRVNAGHGLNYANTPALCRVVPHLETLNIGHSIVARAVFVGLLQAVREMLAAMKVER